MSKLFNPEFDKLPDCKAPHHDYQKVGEWTYRASGETRYVMVCRHCLDAREIRQ